MAMLGLSSHSLDCVHPVVNSTLGTMADAGPKDHTMAVSGASQKVLSEMKRSLTRQLEAQSQAATEGEMLR